MTIWAHSMIKNEARWLWYSVSSVIDHVDRLLLWDTGSTDASLEIEKIIKKTWPQKIELKYLPDQEFDEQMVRQQMLDVTDADWFLVVDGDEIWWEGSIRTLLREIEYANKNIESIVVPTINVVGDMFHYQDESAGKYRFGDFIGNYGLRAVNRYIPGLHSFGEHGVWGWVDGYNKMIQDRNSFKFINAPYFHTTFLNRSDNRSNDINVIKRAKKLKYEIGNSFSLDYFYPEAFFYPRPDFIKSPWEVVDNKYKIQAIIQTPLKKIKRNIWGSKPGY